MPSIRTRDLQEEILEREKTEESLRTTRDELATILAVSQGVVSTLELGVSITRLADDIMEKDRIESVNE